MRPPKPRNKQELIFRVVNHLANQITAKSKQAAPPSVLEAFQNLIDKIDEQTTYEKKFNEFSNRLQEAESELNRLITRFGDGSL